MSDTQMPLRLGVIGGSTNSAVGYAHFNATRMDGLFEYAAGCFSRNGDVNAHSAHVYGVEKDRTYADWRDLLSEEQGRLDAVLILTPTPNHYENLTRAIAFKHAVICEKALSKSVSEALGVRDLVQQNKSYLAVTYNYSGYPMIRELRQMIRAGSFGKIQQIQIEMPQEGYLRKTAEGQPILPQEWRLRDDEIATLHLDLGVHVHQIVHYLSGARPISVVASEGRFGPFHLVDNLNAMAQYEDGMMVQFWYSKVALGHRNGLRVRIYGEDASAEWFQAEPETVNLSFADGRREIRDRAALCEVANGQRYTRFKAGHPAGYIEAFANLYRDIFEDISSFKSGATLCNDEVFGVDLALEGLEFLTAMKQSSSSGKWVSIAREGGGQTE